MREVNTKIYQILRMPIPEELESISQVVTDNIVKKAQNDEATNIDLDVSSVLDKKATSIHNKGLEKKKVTRATGRVRPRKRPTAASSRSQTSHRSTAKKVVRKKPMPQRTKEGVNKITIFLAIAVVGAILAFQLDLI